MKTRLCALFLALALPLCGCQSMLEREQASVKPHPQDLTLSSDSSQLQAETYQELVSAVLYLVTQRAESGTVRFYNYSGDPEADVAAACLEVVQRDPMGAFLVDYIKHSVNRIVSYHEASFSISYRRPAEETPQVTSVTGSSAIKNELRSAMSTFSPVVALRVSYFSEDEDYLRSLIDQAYYDTPISAFGMPEVSIALYPDSGIQRIVEITLDYPLEGELLALRQSQVEEETRRLISAAEATPFSLYHTLHQKSTPTSSLLHNTTHAALYNKYANSEGFALAYKMLCDESGIPCTVVQGSLGEVPYFWNIVTTHSGSRHVDLFAGLYGLTDTSLTQKGDYHWASSYPICRDGSESFS